MGAGGGRERENDVFHIAHLRFSHARTLGGAQKSGRAFTVRAYLELRFLYRTRA